MARRKVQGARLLRLRLQHIRRQTPELFEPEYIGPLLVARMRARIKRGVDVAGQSFVPLKKETARRKGHDRPLQYTGSLIRAIDVLEGQPSGTFAFATGLGFRIGLKHIKVRQNFANTSRSSDTAVYGRVHQLGNSRTPQRRFLGLNAADRRAVYEKVRRGLSAVVKGGVV